MGSGAMARLPDERSTASETSLPPLYAPSASYPPRAPVRLPAPSRGGIGSSSSESGRFVPWLRVRLRVEREEALAPGLALE